MDGQAQTPAVNYAGITFYTEWSTPLVGADPDLDRHAAFVAFAVGVMNDAAPWLMPLLRECHARAIAGPLYFSFELPSARGVWHDVPELAARLTLLPWAEPDEVAH